MSKRSDLLYLGHMLDAARKAQTRAAAITRAEFDANEDVQIVLTHLIQIIGEAARQTPDHVRKTHPAIPWQRIIGMRHRVVHDYLHVNPDILWETATERLPELIAILEKIIPGEPPA